MNGTGKKITDRVSSKEYYHESKFNWNMRRRKNCSSGHQWWKAMNNGDISNEAWKSTYKKYPWWKEEMVKEEVRVMYWLN